MKKIVFLYPNLTELAGTERVLIDKANYLAEYADYDIAILTYEHGTHPIAYPISTKIKHIDLNICFYQLYRHNRLTRLAKLIQLKRLLQKRYNSFINDFQPDIVTTFTYYIDALRIVAKCPSNYVRILESHVDKSFLLDKDPTASRDYITRLRLWYESTGVDHYAKQFDILVALTQHDADNWARYLNTTIITNMINTKKAKSLCQLENKRVIFAGRYAPEKGIYELFKIWEIVNRKHPDWHLDLYGSGPLHDELEAMSKHKDINIHINKPVSDIYQEYSRCSIFVLCSVYETFGLVLAEAMSCGLPVVSFDSPFGPRQIITDGVDGFLIPNRDIQLFASRICELIESKFLRKKMGIAAIKSSKRFDSEHIIPKWIELYDCLCNKFRK